jgi:hypothetical protein
MSGKQTKKLRQLYRRDLGQQAKQQAQAVEAKMKEFTEKLDTVLKPPPKWMPEFIWVSMQRIFLNI